MESKIDIQDSEKDDNANQDSNEKENKILRYERKNYENDKGDEGNNKNIENFKKDNQNIY